MTDPNIPPSEQDNTPLALPEEADPLRAAPSPAADVDRTLWLTIGGIVFVSCCGLLLMSFLFTRTALYQEMTASPLIPVEYTPPPTPNMRATEQAWKVPGTFPTLADLQETERALADDTVLELYMFSNYRPTLPDVTLPGEVYNYSVAVRSDQDAIWEYGWCALTQAILDENIAQMRADFFLNGKPISDTLVVVEDYKASEDYYCHTYNILVTDWPGGTHLLAVDVTFLLPTDDGWNVYPPGTHTFQYFVTVIP